MSFSTGLCLNIHIWSYFQKTLKKWLKITYSWQWLKSPCLWKDILMTHMNLKLQAFNSLIKHVVCTRIQMVLNCYCSCFWCDYFISKSTLHQNTASTFKCSFWGVSDFQLWTEPHLMSASLASGEPHRLHQAIHKTCNMQNNEASLFLCQEKHTGVNMKQQG